MTKNIDGKNEKKMFLFFYYSGRKFIGSYSYVGYDDHTAFELCYVKEHRYWYDLDNHLRKHLSAVERYCGKGD